MTLAESITVLASLWLVKISRTKEVIISYSSKLVKRGDRVRQ